MHATRWLVDRGICSHHQAKKLIASGRLMVDTQRADFSTLITDSSTVEILSSLDCDVEKAQISSTISLKDNVRAQKCKVYLLYNKPWGVVCTTNEKDPRSWVNILNDLPVPKCSLLSVGRLVSTDITIIELCVFWKLKQFF